MSFLISKLNVVGLFEISQSISKADFDGGGVKMVGCGSKMEE
jgi:hypothetical protein